MKTPLESLQEMLEQYQNEINNHEQDIRSLRSQIEEIGIAIKAIKNKKEQSSLFPAKTDISDKSTYRDIIIYFLDKMPERFTRRELYDKASEEYKNLNFDSFSNNVSSMIGREIQLVKKGAGAMPDYYTKGQVG